MLRQGRFIVVCFGLISAQFAVGFQTPVFSSEPATLRPNENARPLEAVSKPLPIQDDAQLRDVCLVDSQVGYAVGDQGAIWKTEDGGATWKWVQTQFCLQLYRRLFFNAKNWLESLVAERTPMAKKVGACF